MSRWLVSLRGCRIESMRDRSDGGEADVGRRQGGIFLRGTGTVAAARFPVAVRPRRICVDDLIHNHPKNTRPTAPMSVLLPRVHAFNSIIRQLGHRGSFRTR